MIGALPRVEIKADIVLALEAPADEETLPGGLHGPDAPYVEIALGGNAAPGLDKALRAWDRDTWGGQS